MAGEARQDRADTTDLLGIAAGLDPDALTTQRMQGPTVLPFDMDDVTARSLQQTQVHTKEARLAAIRGHDVPDRGEPDLPSLAARHEVVSDQRRTWRREVAGSNAWGDSIIDALCDPPERFSQGGILAHVLAHASQRRALTRHLLAASTTDMGTGIRCGG